MEGKLARITFDDRSFQRLIEGETLKLEVRPDTVEIEITLDEQGRFRASYREVIERALSATLKRFPHA